MHIDPKQGLLIGIPFVASPNCDTRPEGAAPELIVIHNISLPPGEFGGPWIEALFTNCLPAQRHPYFAQIASLRVSSHVVIQRNGAITQYVPFHERAWHAGESCYQERTCCNDFSIGIELEGTDDIPFEAAQYLTLSRLTRALLCTYHTLSKDRITGHTDIASGRKTDPGPAFDWAWYRQFLDAPL